jgi:two-component system sensor histidine kinase DesK
MLNIDTIPKKSERNWAWLWLAYTGFLFIDPIMEPSSHRWLGTLVVFSVFIAIFSGYVRANDEANTSVQRAGSTNGRIVLGQRTRLWMIAATFLLGLVTFPWNAGASTFFVYTAAFLPFSIKSIRLVLSLFVAESVIRLAEGYFFRIPDHLFYIGWPNVLIAIFLLLLIGCGNIAFAEQKRADNKLRRAQEENLTLAAVAERERIARDLHDVLGHTLSVIVLKAELAGRLIERDPQRAAHEISDVEKTARTALSEVREAIGGYRSQGLPAEMELARSTLQAAGVTLSCETPLPHLHATEETVLCLAVREAVTNIVRHAQATHCRIGFNTSVDGYHSLFISDDGTQPKLHEGNGLRGMRERVQSLGARLSISTDPGVTLHIELPQTAARQLKAPCVVV